MRERVLQSIRRNGLLKAGERVGVAVSGGADSVALLRALGAAREELGVVLHVVHFNHGIRGAESDADEQFVRELAKQVGLGDSLHISRGDAPAESQRKKLSLETAARELRHAYFDELLKSGTLDKIATAHTMDDQAETVLMRLLRGAGTRGLAGIYPEQKDLRIVRPLLEIRRAEVEAYLKTLGQDWREDATNRDPAHTRNRIRHELLPMLARDYNPRVVELLAALADTARGEEEFWQQEMARLLPLVERPGEPVRGGGRSIATQPGAASFGLDLESLRKQPMAVQRRLVRAAAAAHGISLDAEHVEEALRVVAGEVKGCQWPGGWSLRRSARELRVQPPE